MGHQQEALRRQALLRDISRRDSADRRYCVWAACQVHHSCRPDTRHDYCCRIPRKMGCFPTLQKCSHCSDWAVGWTIRGAIPGGHEIFLSKSFSPALASTKPPFQCALGSERHLTTRLHPVPRLRVGWSCTSTPLICL
jgi:hypothetical protein